MTVGTCPPHIWQTASNCTLLRQLLAKQMLAQMSTCPGVRAAI